MKTLVCEYGGEIIAYGTVRSIEEFICIEIPNMHPQLMTIAEFRDWLIQSIGWKLQK